MGRIDASVKNVTKPSQYKIDLTVKTHFLIVGLKIEKLGINQL